ncbi:MAG: hypothetical protein J1E06_05200 [Acutalibacter sp.]|nr:hypothetical protein [Acutalibacter sp.]
MITHEIVIRVIGRVLISLLIAGVIIIQISRVRKKRLWTILLAVVWFIVYFCYSAVPLEEPFLVFSTPEEAFHYKYSDYEIRLIIEGSESTQIVSHSEQGRASFVAILPKTEKGWKPEIQWDRKIISHQTSFNSGSMIFLQRYKNTNDYYLTVTPLLGIDDLHDNKGTVFQSSKGAYSYGKKFPPGYYCAYFDGMEEDYVLTIDGEEFTFPNAK